MNAETILPKTKTPGAKELGVPQFIDKMVNDTMDAAGKEKFVKDFVAAWNKVMNLDRFDLIRNS